MEQTCRLCRSSYEISEADLAFYEKVSPTFAGERFNIPPPAHCPSCRQQRRLSWRNEQNLYRRSCNLCQKTIVSVHHAAAPYPVYCLECWWSDRWNPLDFGIELDLTKPFLEQFAELQRRVPQLAIQNDNGIGSENSEYCYDISRGKNCYRVIGSWYMEECYYSLNVNRSKFLVDCNTVSVDCELVYESLDSQRLYHCGYMQNCEGCSNCFFGYDLKGCRDCFACVGLRQKQWHIFNQPYSEADYRAKIAEFDFGSAESVAKMRAEFDAWALTKPRRAANLQNCEDSVGNNLFNCKGVLGYSVFSSEHSRFIDRCDGPIHCYDLINTGGAQWCCDCVTPDDSYQVLFSVWCWKSKYILYSDNCHSSEHLFGCISLRRNQYCILNKQYSRQEYERLAGEIVRTLARDRAWGEHPPVTLSPFAYNESAAQEYFPLTRDETTRMDWRWRDDLPDTKAQETIQWSALADSIDGINDDILKHVLACTECGKNYKIIPHELSFYRKMPAPLPRRCPACRHLARFHRKTRTRIWTRSCDKCGQPVQTCFAPEQPEVIHCDECYLAELY